MDGKTEFCPVATKKRRKKDTTIHHKRRYGSTRRHRNHNHPLTPSPPSQTAVGRLLFGTCETNAPFLSLGYIPLFISICKHRHERTRGPWVSNGGSSMLRSRLASSSPPHSAGTERSEDQSSPCTRGKPAPGKHPATSTTRSPGQLAQPRAKLPRGPDARPRTGGGEEAGGQGDNQD